jgi:putative redox protein
MSDTTRVSWRDGMTFDAELDNHTITMDAAEKFGGRGLGARPKAMLLPALAGCTGMDVIAILNKMRVTLDGFDLEVSGNMTAEHPKVYDAIHLTYTFRGKDLDRSKLERAVELSQKTYCGVTAMLGKTAAITYEIRVAE